MTPSTTIQPENRPVLISCGILKREIKMLVQKNQWAVKLRFLDSSLHIDFDRLHKVLTGALSKERGQKKVLVYGTCHPRMDDLLLDAHAARTPGQNCVELLMGKERFTEELSRGAFFLFEDWARRWEEISYRYFKNWEVMREIFQDAHRYILCIRTPCSTNFETDARELSEWLGLPLVWEDFDLNQLEKTLQTSISRAMEGDHA